jgi:hypothetical protein
MIRQTSPLWNAKNFSVGRTPRERAFLMVIATSRCLSISVSVWTNNHTQPNFGNILMGWFVQGRLISVLMMGADGVE